VKDNHLANNNNQLANDSLLDNNSNENPLTVNNSKDDNNLLFGVISNPNLR
jgi:hypothetical protein